MQPSDTALIVPIPGAEALVSPWRTAYDPAAAMGVPAHITLLYPFLKPERLNARLNERLGELFGGFASFSCRLQGPETYPGLLHLRPEPASPFVALREAVRALWPQLVPYGGKYGDQPPPHLTVALSAERLRGGALDFEPIFRQLGPSLPLTVAVEEVWLEERRGDLWHKVAAFPLRKA